MAFAESMEGVPTQVLLHDLLLELDAVNPISRDCEPLVLARHQLLSIPPGADIQFQWFTPERGQYSTPIHSQLEGNIPMAEDVDAAEHGDLVVQRA